MLTRSITIVACVLGLTASPLANVHDQGTMALQQHEVQADPLETLSFLTGTWQGQMGDNDFVEEVWSEARGGAMMGMFRWVSPEGRPRMYELLTISTVGEDVMLRLRHFTAELVAWEEKGEPVQLKLAQARAGRAVFENVDTKNRLERIVFFTTEAGGLGIDVEFRADSGRPPLNFRMARSKQ